MSEKPRREKEFWEGQAPRFRLSSHDHGNCELCDQIESEKAALEAKLNTFVEALIWCSGSPDFNDGGQAREGWLKLCAPLLATLTAQEEQIE